MPKDPGHPGFGRDAILAAALDAVILIDEDSCVLEWNPAAEEMFGYRRAEALGRPLAELILPPALRRARRDGLKRVLDGGSSQVLGHRLELSAMRADGSELPVAIAITRTATGPPMFTAWIRDMTENKAVEAESARRKYLLKRVEELAHSGSWEWTPETGQLVWSDSVFRLFGMKPGGRNPTLEQALGRTHPDDRERVRRSLDLARREGELPPTLVRIVRPDASVRLLRATGGVERREAGKPERLLGAVQDVTNERRADREVAAHLAVSVTLTEWDSLERSGEGLLRELTATLEFAVGALWLRQGDVLAPRHFWSAPPSQTREFERATGKLRLPMGLDLPGRAWERRQPIDLASVVADGGFVRHEDAALDGLRAGVATPALSGGEVLAVVELYSRDRTALSKRLIRLLSGIGYELGAFLARRRGELNPQLLTPRQLEILQLAAQGLSSPEIAERLVVSGFTVKTHLQHIYARLGVTDRAAAVAQGLRDGLIQ